MALAALYAFFDGAAALLSDEAKPAPTDQIKALLRKLQQMAIAADEQINKAVQSCKRARSQRLETMATVMSRKFAAARSDDIGAHEMHVREARFETDQLALNEALRALAEEPLEFSAGDPINPPTRCGISSKPDPPPGRSVDREDR